MRLRTWRKRGAFVCLAGVALMLLNSPAVAAWIDSQLLARESPEAAAQALLRAQAVAQLEAFGVVHETAGVLVDAVLAADPAQAADGRIPLDRATLVRVLEALGCSPGEARAQAAWLSSSELQWLQAQGAYAFAHAGKKVVGVNYTGLMILLLPVLVAVVVAAAAGQSAAGVALGAFAVGVVFVLLVEPKFLIGDSSETAK